MLWLITSGLVFVLVVFILFIFSLAKTSASYNDYEEEMFAQMEYMREWENKKK